MATTEQTFEHLRSAGLADLDPDIAGLIDRELQRQREQIELIASENFTWPAVLEAAGSVLTNKYAEGYPGKRYYGGCEWVDEVEQLAIDRAKSLFGADHANVQPHAGGPANLAAYFAMLEPGDPILGLRLDHGGHLTHGLKVNFSGRLYDFHSYGVRREDSLIDFDEVQRLAHQHRPRLIVAGASAYPRIIDAARFREIADEVGARLMVDMAHFSGLVAAGLHPNPVEYADVVTSTTHKTLAGPRAGLVLCRAEHAAAVDKAVFPGLQGGPLCHIVAAKAICFRLAATEAFRDYQQRIVANAKALAATLMDGGLELLTGGTDTHLLQLDLRATQWSGKDAEERLRGGLDHGQPQHGSVRRAPADDRVWGAHRHAGRDDAGVQRGRHARGGRDHPRHPRPGGRPGLPARAHARASGRAAALLRASAWLPCGLTAWSFSTIRSCSTSSRCCGMRARIRRTSATSWASWRRSSATRRPATSSSRSTASTTPLEVTPARRVSGKKLGVVAVLRAGLGMLDAVLDLIPVARVGFVGVYRDEETLEPVEYYCKLPGDLAERDVLVLDPMLATGGSASEALRLCKRRGAVRTSLLCVVAAPAGVERIAADHPDVAVYTASLDRELNAQGYILPGLGDAGDRLFGTR